MMLKKITNMQTSVLTYQMKPVFHPENCHQSKEEQTGIISVRQNLVIIVVAVRV